jgi:hypothetical protein
MIELKSFSMAIKKLKTKIAAVQRFLALRLSAYETTISLKQKQLLLVLFCFLFGLASIYIIVTTFTRGFSGSGLPSTLNSIPYHIGKSFHQPGTVIDEITYNRVEHFKQFLDSLKQNNTDKFFEIMNTRPHLYDSILAFENIYQLQLKK